MLFHTTFKGRVGFTEEDQKRTMELWSKWQPPEGMEIKSFYMAVGGGGFIISNVQPEVNAASPITMPIRKMSLSTFISAPSFLLPTFSESGA